MVIILSNSRGSSHFKDGHIKVSNHDTYLNREKGAPFDTKIDNGGCPMNENIITILNSLIETLTQGARAFYTATARTQDLYLQSIFRGCAESYQRLREELYRWLAQLTGEAPSKAHDMLSPSSYWVGINTMLVDEDKQMLLTECECIEEQSKTRYQQALHADLPANIHLLLEKHYNEILKNYNIIHELKDKYANR